MLKQNNQELNFELEKLRETETNASFMSSNSFTQTMIQDLELKIQSLQSQNEALATKSEDKISLKLVELENKLLQSQRENKSLLAQVE